MAVYVNNIVINSGSSFSQEITLENDQNSIINLSGYGISSYIRKHPESSNIVAGFGVTIVNSIDGKIKLSLGSTITSTIKEGRYVYDVLAVKPDQKKLILVEGNILVRVGVSS